ncbi:efflux transporter outer membrane subunit [Chromobacterium paludis]|uniref:Efflux transporter outer membrane subunit n=2 Tax=Chromobacterium paludis TaxID=2605945 RepID=A0A5C1DP02_9NEIS|nr:efflux transporter outer membrane subunit [Chromobacterium paludis]
MARCGAMLALGGALAGCAAIPDLGPKPQLRETAASASSRSLSGAGQNWADQQWWTRYHDVQLDQMMSEALAHSPDLATAQARLLKSEGYAQTAGASLLPGVDLNASTSRLKQSYNNGVPKALAPQGFNSASRAALDFSYEIDFWGKNRAQLAAATSELEAARAEAAQSRLMLTSAIATGYAQLAGLYADRDAAEKAVQVRRNSVELLKDRQWHGLETLGSVEQAESRRAASEADLIAADEAISLQRNSLAALLGAGPDRGLTIRRPTVDLSHPQALPATVQAELIGRRPDLASARLRAEAAARRIDVARAGFFPNVNLTAYAGGQSLGAFDLLAKSGSGIAGIGPAINLPIFRGGQLQGEYRVARADYDAAVASYNQTLIQALREVADAVTRQRTLEPQLWQRKAALEAAQEAYRVANDRYRGGLANYLTVLNAEDSVIDTRRVLTDLQSQQFMQDIALIKALGGGYRAASL